MSFLPPEATIDGYTIEKTEDWIVDKDKKDNFYEILLATNNETKEKVAIIIHDNSADPQINTSPKDHTILPMHETDHISIQTFLHPLKEFTDEENNTLYSGWYDRVLSDQFFAKRKDNGALLNEPQIIHTPGTEYMRAYGPVLKKEVVSTYTRIDNLMRDYSTMLKVGLKKLEQCRLKYN